MHELVACCGCVWRVRAATCTVVTRVTLFCADVADLDSGSESLLETPHVTYPTASQLWGDDVLEPLNVQKELAKGAPPRGV